MTIVSYCRLGEMRYTRLQRESGGDFGRVKGCSNDCDKEGVGA